MLFSSFTFIFAFLPIVWVIFHLLKCARFKAHYTFAKIFLIISSLFFYAFWKVAYLPILLSSIIVNYTLAKMILKSNSKVSLSNATTLGGGGNHYLVSNPTSSLRESRSDSWQSINQKWIASASPRNDGIRFTPKFFFICGIIFNLCLLGFFKYTDFLLENFNAFSKLAHLDFNIPLPHILLPLALSFVTFQQIAFLFDCYKRTKGELDENLRIDFIDYTLFISFFPQLIAGPIVHHREMMPQFARLGNSSLDKHSADLANFGRSQTISLVSHPKFAKNYESQTENPSVVDSTQSVESNKKIKSKKPLKSFCYFWLSPKVESPLPLNTNLPSGANLQNLGAKSITINYEFLAKGIFIFSIGLFKKVFIADSFAKWANAGFSVVESGGFLNIAESWATSLSYTFQLYFDFSGYCDMAIGLALMFGIVLPLNFDSPYKSLNISEFWRRWHITLGRFLRECLYIPLGGNRVNKILNLRNLFIVAFLSGIWHGAGWGFVIWGMLHGVAMMIHRIYSWWLTNSACGDFSRSASAHSLQRTPSASHSFASHNHENSHTILEFASCKENAKSVKAKFLYFTQTRLYKILCWFITFNFVNLAWIFFRSENLNGAVNLIKGMFGIVWVELPQEVYIDGIDRTFMFIIVAMLICVVYKNSFEIMKDYDRFIVLKSIFATILFIICLCVMCFTNLKIEFLYFNF